jgi:glucose uptake protein GlcU
MVYILFALMGFATWGIVALAEKYLGTKPAWVILGIAFALWCTSLALII